MTELTPEQQQLISSLGITQKPAKKSAPYLLPLLSISGLSFISFGGLILFKSRATATTSPPAPDISTIIPEVSPTQVPKSIQHYLLTSQQFFTQALTAQSNRDQTAAVDSLNKAILAASEGITTFPSDYRGYEQRGRIYQSLIDSQPQVLSNAIADLSQANKLNPNSPEITRSLATLFGRQGDAQNTLVFLTQTVNLEPTKAQNFYDLARIQQQTGLLPQALETYNRLITIVSDPAQKIQVEAEKSAIQNLLSQNKNPITLPPASPTPPKGTPTIILPDQPSLLQAGAVSNLIIAAPETSPDITVNHLVDTNSLAGSATLKAGNKQVSLTNTNLTSASQVYVTITKGGKNLSLQVLSRSGQTFAVGLDSPTTDDIEFKWWIINP